MLTSTTNRNPDWSDNCIIHNAAQIPTLHSPPLQQYKKRPQPKLFIPDTAQRLTCPASDSTTRYNRLGTCKYALPLRPDTTNPTPNASQNTVTKNCYRAVGFKVGWQGKTSLTNLAKHQLPWTFRTPSHSMQYHSHTRYAKPEDF